MTRKPDWAEIWLSGAHCERRWDDWQPVGVPILTWVAHVKTYRCPSCGKRGRNILLRLTPLASE